MKKEAEDAKKTEEPAEELTGEESTETAEEPIDEATERANAKIAADKAFWDLEAQKRASEKKKALSIKVSDSELGDKYQTSSKDKTSKVDLTIDTKSSMDYETSISNRRSKKLGLILPSVSGMKNYDDITAACNFIVTLGIYTFGFQSVSGLDIRKEFKTYNEGGVNDHSILCGSPNYNTYELSFRRGLLLRTSAMMGSMVALAAVLATSVVVPSNIARRTAAFAVGSTIDPQTVLENGPTLGTIQVFDRNRTRLQGLFSFVSLGMKSWRADDLDATSGSIWYEDITIAHTGLTRHPVDTLPWGNVNAQGTGDSAYSARNEDMYKQAFEKLKKTKDDANKEIEILNIKKAKEKEKIDAILKQSQNMLNELKLLENDFSNEKLKKRADDVVAEFDKAKTRRQELADKLKQDRDAMAKKLKTTTFTKEDADKLTKEQEAKDKAIKDRAVTTTAEENKTKSDELTAKQKAIDAALKSKLKTTTELDNIKASEELTAEQQTKAQAIKDRQKTSDFSEIDEDLKTRATAAQKIVPKQAGKVTSDFSKVDKELADRAKKASGNVPKQSATVTTEHKKGDATPVDADLKAKGDKAKDKLKKDDNK